MTAYINTKTAEYPLTELQVREAFPNTALPQDLSPPDPFAVVESVQPPTPGALEYVEESTPALVDGAWTQQWRTVALTSDQVAALLASTKDAQRAVVSQACQDAILVGFPSSALGSEHTYPAKPTDQQNLSASVLASIMPGGAADWTTPFWCADSAGAWAYVMHTAAQIQQVGVDGKAAILACLTKNQELASQIDAATTVEAVRAINWS